MGTQRTKAQLIQETTDVITSGVEDGITGAILNQLLDDYSESLLFNQGSLIEANSADAFLLFTESNSAVSFAIGIDNSDSDNFKISNSTALGTTDALTISNSTLLADFNGNVSISKSGAGDVSLLFTNDASVNFILGLNDTDNFKISNSTALGTTDALTISNSTLLADFNGNVSISKSGAGDVSLLFTNGAAKNFILGIDDSDVDQFKISVSTALGTTDAIKITTAGNVDVPISFRIAGTVNVVAIIDDDTMATATSSNLATSESIKAYADGFYNLALASLSISGDTLALWSKSQDTALFLHLNNTSTNVNGHATIKVSSTDTGGDASIYFALGGSGDWHIGADNSDANKFVLSKSNLLGTNNVIEFDTSDNIICPTMPTASAGLPSGALWADSGTIKIIA